MTLYTNFILEQIQKHADQQPKSVALQTTSGQSLTWQNLNLQIDNLAKNLIKNGFEQNQRVLFLVKPSLEAIIVLLGVVRAGGVLITADPAMGSQNFASRVSLARPKWVFAESVLLSLQSFPWLRKLAKDRGIEIPEMHKTLKQVKIVRVGKWLPGYKANYNLAKLLKLNQSNFTEQRLQIEDIQITFTSGTTSFPKAVVHTHESFEAMVKMTNSALQSGPNDVFYTNQYYILLPALVSGNKVILNTHLSFKAQTYLQEVQKYQITTTFDIPKNYLELIRFLKTKKLTIPESVKTIMLGSTPVLKGFLQELKAVIAPTTQVWSIYGMTEILPVAIVEMTEKLAFKGEGDLLGSCLPGIEFKTLENGELVLTGPNLADRFLTNDDFPDNKVKPMLEISGTGGKSAKLAEITTGDICQIDQQNRLVLLARQKDMIIKGHYNIYPTLFESTISQIQGVETCAMLGQFNEHKQEEEIILVIQKNSPMVESEFREFVLKNLQAGQFSIDKYALPDQIVFLEQMPTSGRSQKIDKIKLKEIISNYVQN